jgi:uncharacterized protein YyaL (SSP411 family)
MLAALSTWHAGMLEVAIVGPRGAVGTGALRREVDRSYQPFAVVVPVDAGGEGSERLVGLLPWVSGQTMREGRPTAYVCRNFACERPTTEPAELAERLREA